MKNQTHCAGGILLLLLTLTSPVYAEHVVNMVVENDLFTGTDRHYTSGVMLNYISGVDDGPKRLKDMGVWFPGIHDDDKIHVSFSLGHEIYTPTEIRIPTLLEDDRPYAGYLYIATGFSTANEKEVETWRVNLGIVGPSARGEEVQNTVHKRVGSDDALGWSNELEDEWVLSVTYEKKWLNRAWTASDDWRIEADFIPHVGAAIGTPRTYAGLGGTLRVGKGLQKDQGPPKVRPSLPMSQFYDGTTSWYFFLGVEGRYVAHNLFLDGNNFKDSHSVDREDFGADLQAGFVLNTRNFRLGYTYVVSSREFVQQDERDLYGSLSFSVHF